MVTLSHFDMPYVLENDFGGWLNPESIEWFVEFASLCFEEFSSLVPYWLTFNEPMQTVTGGWENGNWPPGMSSNQESIYCIQYPFVGIFVQNCPKLYNMICDYFNFFLHFSIAYIKSF